MLILPIKKKWFDMIMSGEKLEEYREIKPYWTKRLEAYPDRFYIESFFGTNPDITHVVSQCKIRAGYNKTSPTAIISYWIDVGTGNSQWGAEPNVEYYRLHIVSKEME